MQLTNDRNELSWGGLINAVQNIEDATSMSLTQYTKRATVNSRVFIEKSLANEEILTPLMLNIMNLYSGLIMTAVDMNQYVQGSRKVRDVMSIVSTESLKTPAEYSEDKMHDFFMGSRSEFVTPKMLSVTDHKGNDIFDNDRTVPLESDLSSNTGNKFLDPEPKNANLPSGRILELNFGSAKDVTNKAFTIHLFLQLIPSFVPTDVANAFVGLNFTPGIRQRWLQASAGEIGFFKDLVMAQDRRKARMKALKQDRSGALKEMIERQENSLSNSWLKLAFVTPERQNIANTILIFEKSSFDKACSKSGLKFKDYNSRQKFFNKSFAMILCTIDPMYNKIDMYYHGLQAVSTFTFEQVKRNAKTEQVDLMSVMKTYAQGMAPKF